MFTSEGGDSAVRESGVGVVIGQLGIVGLIGYAVLFISLAKACSRVADKRNRVLGVTLTLAFLANAMFNEVALSPNSAAPYFVIIGLIIGREFLERPDFTAKPEKRAKSLAAPSATRSRHVPSV